MCFLGGVGGLDADHIQGPARTCPFPECCERARSQSGPLLCLGEQAGFGIMGNGGGGGCKGVWRVNEVVWLKVSVILFYDKHQMMLDSLEGIYVILRQVFYLWNVKVNELRLSL